MAYAANSDASKDDRSRDGADTAAKSASAGKRDSSRVWPLALIITFCILLFYFSKDILSSVFTKSENKEIRKRNAKAMKLFMKYSQ
jgi:uncharacterized membrane protein